MAAFIKLPNEGGIAFIGINSNRDSGLRSTQIDQVELTLDGMKGEAHGGRTRASCSRVSMIYAKGTIIANSRQISVMSMEELDEMQQIGGFKDNQPEWWGANLVLQGIRDLSALPPSTRLRFPSGAVIRFDVENGPCKYTAEVVAAATGANAQTVLASAKGRRGMVGAVECEGVISLQDKVTVFVPNARPYPYLDGD